MKHKIAIKQPGKPLETMEVESLYRSDIRPLISDDENTILQYVWLKRDADRILCLVCDEEGLLKNLPLNFEMLTKSGNHSFLSKVVGTVAFIAYEMEDSLNKEIFDYEIRDLTDEDMGIINHAIDERTQESARKIAEIDPNIHTNRNWVFEPINDIDEFFGTHSPVLMEIPSFLIPLHIFHKIKIGRTLEFYADSVGRQKYVAGIGAENINGIVNFYCKGLTTAQDFTISHNVLESKFTRDCIEKYIVQFITAMHTMGLPAFLYVTEKEHRKLFPD